MPATHVEQKRGKSRSNPRITPSRREDLKRADAARDSDVKHLPRLLPTSTRVNSAHYKTSARSKAISVQPETRSNQAPSTELAQLGSQSKTSKALGMIVANYEKIATDQPPCSGETLRWLQFAVA